MDVRVKLERNREKLKNLRSRGVGLSLKTFRTLDKVERKKMLSLPKIKK